MFEKFGVFVAGTQLNAFIQKEAKFVRIYCMLIQQSGLFRWHICFFRHWQKCHHNNNILFPESLENEKRKDKPNQNPS